MSANLPPGVTDGDIDRHFAGDRSAETAAETIGCWMQTACDASRRVCVGSDPVQIDVEDTECSNGDVTVTLAVSQIDPAKRRAVAHRVLAWGRELLETC